MLMSCWFARGPCAGSCAWPPLTPSWQPHLKNWRGLLRGGQVDGRSHGLDGFSQSDARRRQASTAQASGLWTRGGPPNHGTTSNCHSSSHRGSVSSFSTKKLQCTDARGCDRSADGAHRGCNQRPLRWTPGGKNGPTTQAFLGLLAASHHLITPDQVRTFAVALKYQGVALPAIPEVLPIVASLHMATSHLAAQRLQAGAFSSRTSKPFQASRTSPVLKQPAQPRLHPAAALPDLLTVVHPVLAALEIDWSDPDVQIGAFGAFLGVTVGIGVPLFYISRDERDEARLEELRALNRATKAETGEYLTPVSHTLPLAAICEKYRRFKAPK